MDKDVCPAGQQLTRGFLYSNGNFAYFSASRCSDMSGALRFGGRPVDAMKAWQALRTLDRGVVEGDPSAIVKSNERRLKDPKKYRTQGWLKKLRLIGRVHTFFMCQVRVHTMKMPVRCKKTGDTHTDTMQTTVQCLELFARIPS